MKRMNMENNLIGVFFFLGFEVFTPVVMKGFYLQGYKVV
jgi:hypothetical protein